LSGDHRPIGKGVVTNTGNPFSVLSLAALYIRGKKSIVGYKKKFLNSFLNIWSALFLRHEDGLGRLLEQVLEGAPVRVGGQVVHGTVGGGVELERVVGLLPAGGGAGQRLLGVLHQVLQTSLGHNPTGRT